MLKHIALTNFKCFRQQRIDFKRITLLTGVNSAGKSTVVQSLLLLQQTYAEHWTHPDMQLAGELVNLGLPEDVLCSNAESDTFKIAVECDAKAFSLQAALQGEGLVTAEEGEGENDFHPFFYLNAERLCPNTLFPVPTTTQSYYNRIGNHGEFAAFLLHEHGDEKIPFSATGSPSLLAPNEISTSSALLQQTEAWLSRLGGQVRLRVDRPTGTDTVVLRFSFPDISGTYYRPTNVGFGLTYALPVFVAALSAQAGALLIVENPEAHLHPKGQALMGRFLARAAACGIQVVLETHSDHVLNGIRVGVKQGDIACNDVQINFFQQREGRSCVETPQIDADGHIDFWPDDFFDEWDKQLSELL